MVCKKRVPVHKVHKINILIQRFFIRIPSNFESEKLRYQIQRPSSLCLILSLRKQPETVLAEQQPLGEQISLQQAVNRTDKQTTGFCHLLG